MKQQLAARIFLDFQLAQEEAGDVGLRLWGFGLQNINLSICLSMYLGICLSLYQSMYLSHLSICLSIYLPTCLSNSLPVSLCIYLSIHLSFYLPIYLSSTLYINFELTSSANPRACCCDSRSFESDSSDQSPASRPSETASKLGRDFWSRVEVWLMFVLPSSPSAQTERKRDALTDVADEARCCQELAASLRRSFATAVVSQ